MSGERIILQRSVLAPDKGELSADHRDAIIANADGYLMETRQSRADVARGLGEPVDAVNRVLSGKGPASAEKRDGLLRAINRWIEADHQARQVRAPRGFVAIAPAKRLMSAARNCHAAGVMGLAVGPAGIGKSFTIPAIQAELPGTPAVRVDRDSRSASGLLRAIDDAARMTKRSRVRVSLADLARLAARRLLIVDQAHDLKDNGLRALMDLHDQTGIGILLIGTKALNRRLLDDEDVEFGQLSSRIAFRVELLPEALPSGGMPAKQWLTVDELRRIFNLGKLKVHPDAARMLLQIACFGVGHLRRAGHVLRLAAALAQKDGQGGGTVMPAHVEGAFEIVRGERLTAVRAAALAAGEAVAV